MLDLGNLVVARTEDRKIFIKDVLTGESGQFDLDEFARMVERFFADKF